MAIDARRIMDGTYGEVWLDDAQISECKGLQAKIEFQREDVKLCGQNAIDSKINGWKGTGSLKLFKVNSRIAYALADYFEDGKDIRFSIISKLKDPDAAGTERVKLKGVTFGDLMLADWEAATVGEVEVSFQFTGYQLIDGVEAE